MEQQKKIQKRRFSSVMLSDLAEGDRFHFPGNKTVFEFIHYSKLERGFIYKKDFDRYNKIKKKDLEVIFLRNNKN